MNGEKLTLLSMTNLSGKPFRCNQRHRNTSTNSDRIDTLLHSYKDGCRILKDLQTNISLKQYTHLVIRQYGMHVGYHNYDEVFFSMKTIVDFIKRFLPLQETKCSCFRLSTI